jgi:glutathione peroxidase-family protein
MKHIIVAMIIFLNCFIRGASFYNLSYTRLDGTSISLSTYQGKKVIVFPFNGIAPDISMLRYMDSVFRVHQDSVVVLAVPGLEFDSTANSDVLSNLHDSLGLQFTMAQPVKVEKGSGAGQAPLFQWLTTMTINGHFNRDVEAPGQLFVISKKGTLYSVINSTLYRSVLGGVINTTVREQADSVGVMWVN